MKQNHSHLFVGAAVAALVLLGILTALLTSEYIFFARQMEELAVVKEEYNNNVLALRRAIVDYDMARDAQASEEAVKLEKKNEL